MYILLTLNSNAASSQTGFYCVEIIFYISDRYRVRVLRTSL